MPSNLYIGLMSGTSLDGIDAVLVDFAQQTPRLIAQLTQPFSISQKEQLLALTQPGENEIDRLGHADIDFSLQQAQAVNTLLTQSGMTPGRIRAIGSHGQTVRHRPEAEHPFTLQIGDPSTLAEHTTISVVADFRRRDIAAGGQGAPLVPAFHAACFQDSQYDRIILNIGGIANITLIPAARDRSVSGFDTGPGNILMDAWALRHLDKPFDSNGEWACRGTVIPELLQRLMDNPYFKRQPPKSTGRETFHIGWLEQQLAGMSFNAEDVQATLLQLTAQSIADAIRHQPVINPEVYICGGGARNGALLKRIGALLPQCRVLTTAALGLEPDWVEATAFAWLAKRCLEQQPGNLPAVTGARGDRILGGIYWA